MANNKLRWVLPILNKKRLIISIVALVLLIAIITFVVIFFDIQKYKKYEQYESKMDIYGFSSLYNNGSAKSHEKVTNLEAIKVIIGATLNISDISDLVQTDKNYSGANWIEYAKQNLIIMDDKINENNLKKKIRYIDAIEYLANAKLKLLDIDLSRDAEPKMKDYSKYDKFAKRAIMDLVSNEIISNNENNLNGSKKMAKGELNELIVKFVEKYKIISDGKTVVTDTSKLPSNANSYPYIVEGVDKSIYEQPFKLDYEVKAKSPVEIYKERKEYYKQMTDISEGLYNAILNIDYNTINKETFKETMQKYTISQVEDVTVDKYVQYVKDNKIQIVGSAKAQLPCIYVDGYFTVIRMKLDFEIKSSNTKENILYLDLRNPIRKYIYDSNKYTIYVDAKMSNSLLSDNVYCEPSVIYDILLQNLEKPIKVQEVSV